MMKIIVLLFVLLLCGCTIEMYDTIGYSCGYEYYDTQCHYRGGYEVCTMRYYDRCEDVYYYEYR